MGFAYITGDPAPFYTLASYQNWGIAYDIESEFMYLADIANDQLRKIKFDGSGEETYGGAGFGVGQFTGVRGIAYDPVTEFVYFTQHINQGGFYGGGYGRIGRVKMDGTGWETLGTKAPVGPGDFYSPIGIDYDPTTGFLYVADGHRIVKTKIDGSEWSALTFTVGTVNMKGWVKYNPVDEKITFAYSDSSGGGVLPQIVRRCKIDGSESEIVTSNTSTDPFVEYNYTSLSGIWYDPETEYVYANRNYQASGGGGPTPPIIAAMNDVVRFKMDGTGWSGYGYFGFGEGQFASPTGLALDTTNGFAYVAGGYGIATSGNSTHIIKFSLNSFV